MSDSNGPQTIFIGPYTLLHRNKLPINNAVMSNSGLRELPKKEIDAESLIPLVQARPEIYDITLKNHHNNEFTSKLWLEIGRELNIPVNQCKSKWANLRCSYLRALKNEARVYNDSGKKVKKWHLSHMMSFIKPFCITKSPNGFNTADLVLQKNGDSNNSTISLDSNNSVNADRFDEDNSFTLEDCTKIIDRPPEMNLYTEIIDEPSEETNPHKRARTITDIEVEPEIAFIQSNTQSTSQEDDDLSLFLKSLYTDIKKLSQKRQRKYKLNILQELHTLLDEQEEEQSIPSS